MLDEIINDEINNEECNLKSREKSSGPLLKLFNQRFGLHIHIQFLTLGYDSTRHQSSICCISSEHIQEYEDTGCLARYGITVWTNVNHFMSNCQFL